MAQSPMVNIEVALAGEKLVREFNEFKPVSVAFWTKTDDDDTWYLYIASDAFNNYDRDAGYAESQRLAVRLNSPYLEDFDVKLIPTHHRLAQAALDYNRRYPSDEAKRFHGALFGGKSVDGAYIYPPVAAMSPS